MALEALVVIPGVIARQGQASLLADLRGGWKSLPEQGRVVRLPPADGFDERTWLGIAPEGAPPAQGPLTVAALGFEPPERSVHIHLSLASLDEAGRIHTLPPRGLLVGREAVEAAKILDTDRLTLLAADGVDHGLVWESGSIELGLTPLAEAAGEDYRARLPDGDGEALLRRLIDDSVNFLSNLEFNLRRADEGLPMANLLWPWGAGFRPQLPNLALRRGQRARVFSRELRVLGLARLAGYQAEPPGSLGQAVFPRLDALATALAEERPTVTALDGVAEAREFGREEEAERYLSLVGERLLEPILRDPEGRLTLILPHEDGEGLALEFDGALPRDSAVPLDERVIGDRSVPMGRAHELVERLLRPRVLRAD
ncbi:MAG: hypothetical protein KIT11_02335 [Fimbriimonadaceae bacterium]|nr:hypothetical protein [Fimbriimonadaceae bacterium]QYK54793.1 MAG: hypothetical protein KF733_07200 [Fimbriimonadaceae bacterium]